jgi:3-hydroxyisobutyrate dehydrogenase-like beta-hydroxyacid dehydrogenase
MSIYADAAVLGTGIMGSAMARSLVEAGLRTTVWDRPERATAPLAGAGARVAGARLALGCHLRGGPTVKDEHA